MASIKLFACVNAAAKALSTPDLERFTSVSKLPTTVHITSISGILGMGTAISAVVRIACTSVAQHTDHDIPFDRLQQQLEVIPSERDQQDQNQYGPDNRHS